MATVTACVVLCAPFTTASLFSGFDSTASVGAGTLPPSSSRHYGVGVPALDSSSSPVGGYLDMCVFAGTQKAKVISTVVSIPLTAVSSTGRGGDGSSSGVRRHSLPVSGSGGGLGNSAPVTAAPGRHSVDGAKGVSTGTVHGASGDGAAAATAAAAASAGGAAAGAGGAAAAATPTAATTAGGGGVALETANWQIFGAHYGFVYALALDRSLTRAASLGSPLVATVPAVPAAAPAATTVSGSGSSDASSGAASASGDVSGKADGTCERSQSHGRGVDPIGAWMCSVFFVCLWSSIVLRSLLPCW